MEEILKEEAYVPGQCNIGPAEIRRRKNMGYIGLALMLLFIIIAEVYSIPQLWKLGLFAPAVYALSGFIQARYKFCFLFGFFGLFSMTGKRSSVVDADQLAKDRGMAFRIVTQVFLGSCLITLLYYFLS